MIANIVWLSLAKAAEYLDVSKDTVLRRAVEWTDEPVPGKVRTKYLVLGADTRGMPGSSIPSFTHLTEKERRDAVQYVKFLTAFTDASGKRLNRFEEAKKDDQLAKPIEVPPEPPVTVQSLAEGARLFSKLNCVLCHGETGAGAGPNAPSLKDTQGLYLPPRDFNTGAFRGGHTGRDLFTRISVGLAGTPMVDFDNKVMTDQQRWSVVHFGFTGELNKDGLEDITVSTPSLAASNVLDASGQLVAPKNFKIHGIRQTRRPAPGNACA